MEYRKKKRRIPVRGGPVEPYENEKLYKCWHCGHINTTGRDKVGGAMAIKYSDFVEKSNGNKESMSMGKESAMSINRSLRHFHAALKVNQNGDAVAPFHHLTVVRYGHCAGCGTTTWSG